VVKHFRETMAGIPFTVARWRRFYSKNQVFRTFCMECAYIDNLKAAQLKHKYGDMYKLIAENAIKNVGT
jgi:hypothetical protein